MAVTVVPGEIIPARVFTLDSPLPTNDLPTIRASLSSPTFSYEFEQDVYNPALIIAEHRLSYPERLKADLQTRIERHEHDIRFLYNQNQHLQNKIRELERKQQANLVTQLHWEIRTRIAQALNDTYAQQLIQQGHYLNLRSNGQSYLPVVLSSWAVFVNREPATGLIGMGAIDDEAMCIHLDRGASLRRNGLEESIEFVWGFIPELQRNIMILMFLTRPSNCNCIAHPDPTVRQGRELIHLDPCIPQAEKDFISDFIPMAKNRLKKRLFATG